MAQLKKSPNFPHISIFGPSPPRPLKKPACPFHPAIQRSCIVISLSYWFTTGIHMFIVSTEPSVPSLEQNIPCLRCGYNLRTLSSDARCPECATPISSSLDPALLRYADPSWTSILALAFSLMLISAALQFWYLLILVLLERLDLPGPTGISDHIGVLLSIHSFVDPLFWLAVFIAGRPNPRTALPSRYSFVRRAMRLFALMAMIRALLPVSSPESWIEKPIGQAIELLATILTFIYLLHLARQTGISRIVRHTRIVMVAVILADCYVIISNILDDQNWAEQWSFYAGLFIAGIILYQTYLFFLFRRTLRKSAAFARQYWHFCSPIPPSL